MGGGVKLVVVLAGVGWVEGQAVDGDGKVAQGFGDVREKLSGRRRGMHHGSLPW